MNQYERFINPKSGWTSKWIKYKSLNVYVRKAKHLVDSGEFVDFIDLANFLIVEKDNKRKGLFKEFLQYAIDKGHNLFIENVINEDILN